MKKIVFLSMFLTFGAFAKTAPNTKVSQQKLILKEKSCMICFGWRDVYSGTGEVIGKYSGNCWNAGQGRHHTTIIYQ